MVYIAENELNKMNGLARVAERAVGYSENLEVARQALLVEFPNYFFYRGGNHLAMHFNQQTDRLLLVKGEWPASLHKISIE